MGTLIKLEDKSEFMLADIDHLEADKQKGTYRIVLKTGKVHVTDKDTFFYFITKYNLSAILKTL